MLSTKAMMRPIRTFARPAYSTTHGNPVGDKRRHPPIEHAPGWREELATNSEAFVKADHETVTLEEMRQKTVDYARTSHRDPEVEQTQATYARDQVNGPLGNAGVGEFEGVVGNDDLGPDDAHAESNGRLVTRRVVHHKKTVHKGEPGANV